MEKPKLSLEENIETLKRSKLPTVVTEGNDDYRYYRRIEEGLAQYGVSLFPAGGRAMVLKLFKHRKEIGRNNIVFLADRDLWVFSDIPEEYKHRKIVLTDGYSIENDLYRDGNIENILYDDERVRFQSELGTIIEWYSFCVDRLLNKKDASIAEHPNRILGPNGCIDDDFAKLISYTGRHDSLYNIIIKSPSRLLRGKTLIDLITRYFSAPGRDVKFGRKQLMEIATANKGEYYSRIAQHIEHFFSIENQNTV
jgi:Protein of unknown function (DUF4435)